MGAGTKEEKVCCALDMEFYKVYNDVILLKSFILGHRLCTDAKWLALANAGHFGRL